VFQVSFFITYLIDRYWIFTKKIINVSGKNGSIENSKGNKTALEKVAKIRTKNGHKYNTKTNLKYRPKGRRNIGRPRKKWRDQLYLDD
jgi:hypothetical protein